MKKEFIKKLVDRLLSCSEDEFQFFIELCDDRVDGETLIAKKKKLAMNVVRRLESQEDYDLYTEIFGL